jgi:ATP-binding cassette, subfamily G (WHITE), member 2, PDR
MTSASMPVTSMVTPELALDRVLATLPYIMEDDSSRASSESEERDYEDSQQELYRIATAMTGVASKVQSITTSRPPIKLSRYSTLGTIAKDDPILDPQSTKFDLGKLIQNTVRRADQEGIKARRAGFTFKQLNVSGSGSALNLQKTVGAPLMAPFRIPEIVRSRHIPHRKILRDFNGFLTPGEMLIVLGRPGSGCSTFLKTIAGEVQGLEVDKDSIIHYNGKHLNRCYSSCLTESQASPVT